MGTSQGTGGSRLRQEDFAPRIAEHPSDLIVSKGEPATLNCKAEGRPSPTVEWYKDGERVETDKDDARSHRMLLPSGSLFFLRIVHGRRSKPDEGVYVCVARNYLGEAVSHNASLEVAILRDDFRQNPTDVIVAAGEPAILECQPPRGHPEPTIYWKKDKVHLNDQDERISMRGGKLMISNTKKSDAGMYICVGRNMVGERDSDTAELTVFERPTFTRRPINQVVLEEEPVEFRCQVQGDPEPTVRWRKDDVDLPRGRFDDHTLRIKRTSGGDAGTYTSPPQFVVRPRDQIVGQGRTASFPCETKGNPQPAVFWQKEGSQNLMFPNQARQPSSRFSVSPGGDLAISNVQRSDAGYYICQALTVAGSILAKAQLEVTDVLTDRPPPIIRQGPANQTLGLDATGLLRCQAMGDPIPTISWLKDGLSLLGKDNRMSLQELGSLQIRNLRLTDSGTYTCVATSSSGETSWSAVLDVRESGTGTVSVRTNLESLPGSPSKPQVTDVTRNSVTLSWLPGSRPPSPISSYIIEAFSQSVSNSWQTVADHVKTTLFTVRGLRPNTIYLFMVRAINTHGISDPSPMTDPVRTQDITPPAQGVDHRQVQRELGDVIVRLHAPVVLTPSSIQVTWTVDSQSQFIQGYRVLYRQTPGPQGPPAWQTQDVTVTSERNTVLTGLKRATGYEIKVRPYFNDFQGIDSETKTARTSEEAPSAPPQSVTVQTVGNHNTTSISVSWDPPPAEHQNGLIQEYKIWCVGNESRFHINRTVDGSIRSVVLGGLYPGIHYQVQVAASTSAGVGVPSDPQPITIGSRDIFMTGPQGNNSITEQITDVVKQPAFIAGIGGACWVILMGFSIWLYWRRKKRKGLSNYAVTFQRVEGGIMSNGSRPGLLNPGDSGYPWLADSWPATSLPVNNTCDPPTDLGDRGDVLPPLGVCEKSGTLLSDSAIYSSIDLTTKSGFPSPAPGPAPGHTSSQATPYATTQILHSHSIQELAVDLPDTQWKAPGQPGYGISLADHNKFSNALLFIPDYRVGEGLCNRLPHNQSQDFNTTSSHNSSERSLSGGKSGKKKKNKTSTKSHKTTGSSWSNMPLPPPPIQPLPGTEIDIYGVDFLETGYESDGWCPPPPVKTYLHQGLEDELEEEDRVPTPPVRGVASSPAISFGQQSTATLTPSPREELQPILQAHLEEISRAYHFDINRQAWHVQSHPVPPQAPALPLGYISGALISDIETDVPEEEEEDEEDEELARPLRGMEHTPASSMDNLESSVTGKSYPGSSRPRPSSPFSTDSSLGPPQSHRPPRTSKKHKSSGGRAEQPSVTHSREAGADDLPPPPDPPPCQGVRLQPSPGQKVPGTGNSSDRSCSSLERQPFICLEDSKKSLEWQAQEKIASLERRLKDSVLSAARVADGLVLHTEEMLIPYSKPSFPSPGHLSGHSSSGTASSKGSTGPRKGVGSRGGPVLGGHQRNISDLTDLGYLGSIGQGQHSGDVCKYRHSAMTHSSKYPSEI
uniref:Roundabout, axon guidance receptor, homolog 2 (Drosophila) n=1 Tax=Callorhinchus milii TaxID=7868 RepID=A0A4W3JZU2_CALMI